MKRLLLATTLCGNALLLLAQTDRPVSGGGPRATQPSDELTPTQRTAIINMLRVNVEDLIRQNILPGPSGDRTTQVAFTWPVRQAAGFNDHGYYGVSDLVDHNPSLTSVQDYNCGSRGANSANHRGTDIFTWPFAWQKMNQDAVEVIAAADGIIIGKTDGAADRNCTPCVNGCDWNAVYLQHTDGTVTWYGHLKANKLTSKAIGQSVAAGEYLGVVGSSGNASSPHLHFEVYTDNRCTALVDPWVGGCNNTGGNSSWWAAQEAYRVPTVSKVLTHNLAPSMGACASEERVNSIRNFSPGGIMYVSAYYRDNVDGTVAVHRIFRPDGSVWSAWSQTFSTAYDASWWYWTIALPTSGTWYGVWRYEVTYNGRTESTSFGIGMALPVELNDFTAVAQGGKTALTWSTSAEEGLRGFDVERSSDGNHFEPIGFVAAKNSAGQTAYSLMDAHPKSGRNFYRLRMRDNGGAERFSKTVSVVFGNKGDVVVGPVPFNNSLTIQLPNTTTAVTYQILNTAGKQMCSGSTALQVTENTTGYPPGVYLLMVYEGKELISRQKLLKL